MVPDGEDHQLVRVVVAIGLDEPLVSSDDILSIDQERHSEILTREDVKASDSSDLGDVRIWAVLQDQLEELIECKRAIFATLVNDLWRGIVVIIIFVSILKLAIVRDDILARRQDPLIVLIECPDTVQKLHLVCLDGPDQHLLVKRHFILVDQNTCD